MAVTYTQSLPGRMPSSGHSRHRVHSSGELSMRSPQAANFTNVLGNRRPPDTLKSSEGLRALRQKAHRGSAVLWFLRRHAPMPSKFPWTDGSRLHVDSPGQNSLEDSGSDGGSEWKDSRRSTRASRMSMAVTSSSSSKKRSTKMMCLDELQDISTREPSIMESGASTTIHSVTSRFSKTPNRKPRQLPASSRIQGSQQTFLHQTLLAIGAEVDELSSARNKPGMDFQNPLSPAQRERLRAEFAAHTDAECESLEVKVQQREAEVEELRVRVLQLERVLDTTRAAAVRRTARLRSENETTLGGDTRSRSNSLVSPHARQRHKQRASSSGADADAELLQKEAELDKPDGSPRFKEPHDAAEDRALKLHEQRELETDLEYEYRAIKQQLMQMQINRKVTEAALLGGHAQVLKLRTKALREEKRATQLANELKRVLQSLPRVVEQQLQRLSSAREDECGEALESFHMKFQEERFKYMPAEFLKKEHEEVAIRHEEIVKASDDASRRLHECLARSGDLVGHSETLEDSLNDVSEAWAWISEDLVRLGKRWSNWEEFQETQILLDRSKFMAQVIKEALRDMQWDPYMSSAFTERDRSGTTDTD